MNRAELIDKLANVTPIVTVTEGKQRQLLDSLLAHEGIPIFLGLMLGARQAQLEILANYDVKDGPTIAGGAVIRGVIKGIDLFYDTLLEQAVPSQTDTQEQE